MTFVLSALRYLKRAYQGAPLGIMVVGHSMGGVVARAAVTRGAMDPDLGEEEMQVQVFIIQVMMFYFVTTFFRSRSGDSAAHASFTTPTTSLAFACIPCSLLPGSESVACASRPHRFACWRLQ